MHSAPLWYDTTIRPLKHSCRQQYLHDALLMQALLSISLSKPFDTNTSTHCGGLVNLLGHARLRLQHCIISICTDRIVHSAGQDELQVVYQDYERKSKSKIPIDSRLVCHCITIGLQVCHCTSIATVLQVCWKFSAFLWSQLAACAAAYIMHCPSGTPSTTAVSTSSRQQRHR